MSASVVYAATLDCKGCGACLKTCPERALRPAPPSFDGPPLLTLVDKCTGCGECLEVCPADAFIPLSPEEAPWPA
jgi:ferredoxin